MTATTAPAPSSAATDAATVSSTVTNTATTPVAQPAPPQSLKERMLATATRAPPSPQAAPAAKDEKSGDAPDSSPGKTKAADGDQRSDEDNVDKKKAPDTVPLAAFKARLGEEKSKREAAVAEANTHRLTASKFEKAYELMAAKAERLEAQLREGRAFNETEEELANTQLGVKARELSEQLQAEHAQKLKEITEAAHREERLMTARTQIEDSVTGAVSKYPLVSADEVYRYMTQVHERTQKLPSAVESARLINEHKQKQLEKLGYSRAQVAAVQNPLTVSGPTGGSDLGRGDGSRGSMAAYARAHLGHR